MKKHTILLLCGMLGLMLFASNAFADDPVLGKMKPLLEEDTFCVAHVDLTKIDTTAILNNNREFVEKAFADLGVSREELTNLVMLGMNGGGQPPMEFEAAWKKGVGIIEGGKTLLTEMLGVKEAFLVMGMGNSFPTFGYVAIPKTSELNVEMIKQMLEQNKAVVTRETDGYFLIGLAYPGISDRDAIRESMASHLGPNRPVERADMLAAYEPVKDFPVQILFAVPQYVKRIVTELRPGFPEHAMQQVPALRTVDLPALINGFRFEGIGIDLETGKLLAVAEAETELDAQILAKHMDELMTVAVDEFAKYLEGLAERKKAVDEESASELLDAQEEILLSFYPEVFNRESLTRLKNELLPKPEGKRFTVSWDRQSAGESISTSGLVLTKLIRVNVEAAREAARRMQCSNHMKQMGLAMHNYHDSHTSFPPAYSVDANGKPLHSWRVAVLPFIEQRALYEAIRRDEPWDSEYNRQFHDKMPWVFRCPSCTQGDPKRDATYCLVVGEESFGRTDGEGLKIGKITDGTSNTIMVVERKTPVCWMAPDDVTFDDAVQGVNKIATGLGSEHSRGANVSLADGSVHFISNTIDLNVLRALLTVAGGESVSIPR